MKYIYVDKNNNEVIEIKDKRVEHSDNLIICEVESIPEKYDYLIAENVREEVKNVKETQDDYDEKGNKISVEVVSLKKYNTCNLVAKFAPQLSKSNTEKLLEAERSDKITSLIRKKYSLNEELAILRQRYSKPEKFKEYNLYAESCVNAVPKQN